MSSTSAAPAPSPAAEGKPVYVSEAKGSDETGDGSEAKPFKTALHALSLDINAIVFVEGAEGFAKISDAGLKKQKKQLELNEKKAAKAAQLAAAAAQKVLFFGPFPSFSAFFPCLRVDDSRPRRKRAVSKRPKRSFSSRTPLSPPPSRSRSAKARSTAASASRSAAGSIASARRARRSSSSSSAMALASCSASSTTASYAFLQLFCTFF